MDRNSPIERYRVPLLDIVAELFVMIGLTKGVTIERLSKPLYRLVLGRLRTAESAVRRLIIAAARDIVVEPKPSRPALVKPKTSSKDKGKADVEGKAKRKRRPLFGLFDPLKRFRRRFKKMRRGPEPRIRVLGDPPDTRHPALRGFRQPEPPPPPPAPVVEQVAPIDDDTVDAKHLIRRLLAITDALQDIPRQAMRLARWQARPIEERHPQRESALRPGRPPGYRQRPKHEVDKILKECHWLARNAEPQLDDTS